MTRYVFPAFALLYCRSCQGLRPHKERDATYIACCACGRTIHFVEVVATYSADEYEDPSPIILPQRLLPENRRGLTEEARFAPIGGEYQLKEIDRATLRGEVTEKEIEESLP